MAGPDLVVEAYLAGDWRDLSSRLLPEPLGRPVTIRRGAQDGARQAAAGACTLTLDDEDGALTPLNAMGAYYPHVRRGVPWRVAVRHAGDDFDRTVGSGWGTSSSGGVWSASGGTSVAAGEGRHTHSSVNVLVRTYQGDLLDVEQVSGITVPAAVTGAAAVTGHLARYDSATGDYYWCRLEFNAGGSTTTLKISKRVDGVSTDLAQLVGVPGLAYAAGQALRIRSACAGGWLAVKAWDPSGPEPEGWMLTANDGDLMSAGGYGFQTWLVSGNTNTLPFTFAWTDHEVRVARFIGTAASYRPLVIPTPDGLTTVAQIELGGPMRRMERASPPAKWPLRRTIEATKPLAYWPGEDGDAATSLSSAIPGHPGMGVSGTPDFQLLPDDAGGGVLVRTGSGPLLNVADGARAAVALPASVTAATADHWTVQVRAAIDPATIAGDMVIAEWATPGGTYVRWQIVYTSTQTNLVAYTAAGVASTLLSSSVTTSLGVWMAAVTQNGANMDVFFDLNTPGVTVPGTLAGVTSLVTNPTGQTASEPALVGHFAIWDVIYTPYQVGLFEDPYSESPFFFDWVFDPAGSWLRETAHLRLDRLCAEDDVELGMPPVTDATMITRMGWQPDGTPLQLYRDSADADLGILAESRYMIGLTYLPRQYRYNRMAAMTIDLSTYQTAAGTTTRVVQPVYDDRPVRNDVTVTRANGSSARVLDQDSVDADGHLTDGPEANLASDDQLPDRAYWMLHLGTVDETRHPALPVDLVANPGLVDAWLNMDVGDRVVRTGGSSLGPADQILDGYTETIGPRRWDVAMVCSPAAPWDVAEVDGDQVVPADGSTLDADLAEAGMSLSLASTAENGVWTTDPADFPLDIRVGGVGGAGGERITLSGITGGTSPQTATISARGVNGVQREWAAGTSVDVWDAAIAAH